MKTRKGISLLAVLTVALLTMAYRGNAQRQRLGKVHSLQATSDNRGAHPATAEITGPATLTCLNAVSEVANSKPVPSCHVVAPGFTGNLDIGKIVSLTGTGNVTLTCNGEGPMLRCAARLDIPPPTQ